MRLVLVGGGGHASDVLQLVEDLNAREDPAARRISVAGILADEEVDGRRFTPRGVRQIGSVGDLPRVDATHYVIAAGWPATRHALLHEIDPAGRDPATLIHPSAEMGTDVKVGAGSVVLGGVRVGPLAAVGEHAYLSHGVLVGHDSRIDDFVSVLPGAVVSGDCRLAYGCSIGSNSTVVHGIEVGRWAEVGAGSVVIADVPDEARLLARGAIGVRRSGSS